MNLAGRRFLVTGAAGSIGAAVTRRLISCRAVVAATDVDVDRVDALVANQPDAVSIACDLSLRGEAARLVAEAEERTGPLEGLIHCAAIGEHVAMLDCSVVRWRKIQAVNLTATFELCQAVARRLAVKGDGVLVALASGDGIRPNGGNVPYGASKAGVIGLMRSAAIDLAPYGVRANVLIPGPIDTPLMRQIVGGAVPMLEARTMLGRLGQPEEVAAAAVFLVSDSARYITGSVLYADGGFSSAGVDYR